MVQFLNIGIRPYSEVLDIQKNLHKKRVAGEIDDTVVFCEHYPVFTLGRQDSSADWVSDFKAIACDGIEVVKTDRGGRITYHGPGQLIGYFIFDINKCKLGVKDFVHRVEDVCMQALAEFGINAVRDKEYPGLWAPPPFTKGGQGGILKKLVALGFHVSSGVTMHGFALNVAPDLSHYRHIIPCGIKERGVTSIKELTGITPPMTDVMGTAQDAISTVF